jgi:hypothetical protein
MFHASIHASHLLSYTLPQLQMLASVNSPATRPPILTLSTATHCEWWCQTLECQLARLSHVLLALYVSLFTTPPSGLNGVFIHFEPHVEAIPFLQTPLMRCPCCCRRCHSRMPQLWLHSVQQPQVSCSGNQDAGVKTRGGPLAPGCPRGMLRAGLSSGTWCWLQLVVSAQFTWQTAADLQACGLGCIAMPCPAYFASDAPRARRMLRFQCRVPACVACSVQQITGLLLPNALRSALVDKRIAGFHRTALP